MQPQVNSIGQPASAVDSKHNAGPSLSQWRGRVISLKYFDAKAAKDSCLVILITIVATGVLCTQGFFWGSLGVGVLGIVALASRCSHSNFPDINLVYRELCGMGLDGSDPKYNFVGGQFEKKNQQIDINLTKKELDEIINNNCLFAGGQWFYARVNDKKMQITVIPKSPEASELKFNISIDNTPIDIKNEKISYYTVRPPVDWIKNDVVKFNYNFRQLSTVRDYSPFKTLFLNN